MNSKILTIITILFLIGCNNENSLEEKKEQLVKYKKEYRELESKIKSLEDEIADEDSTFNQQLENVTLVSTHPVKNKKFIHKIEVRGAVESRRNIILSSEIMGIIDKIAVSEGARVQKKLTLLKINAETLRSNIDELNTNLELAKVVYERQKNLWENNIGTEIQYLQAKNNKESLEKKLQTVYSQLEKATIKAPFSGRIDEIFVKEGEMAQPGLPLLRLVSLKDMYLKAEVSERYVGKFKKGDSVDIKFPSIDKTFQSVISSIGQVINNQNRTFTIEIRIPHNDDRIKPNLTAVIHLTDYVNKDALVIPTNLIQNDRDGAFVYIIDDTGDQVTASKIHIEKGISYEQETEVLSGLSDNDQLIDKGFRDVTDGLKVKPVASL